MDQSLPQTAGVEEVVRYLRQQDDVVVPQENGEFLVNGRFRMPFGDLVARANPIRARQGKSKFEVPGSTTVLTETSSADGHPMFWDVSLSPAGRPNGSRQPDEIETEGAWLTGRALPAHGRGRRFNSFPRLPSSTILIVTDFGSPDDRELMIRVRRALDQEQTAAIVREVVG